MPAKDPERRRANALWAIGNRWGNIPAELVEQRRRHKAAALEQHIREVVDSAPPLTAAQRDRLAVILSAGRTRVEQPLDAA
jgi:hypothetical protein